MKPDAPNLNHAWAGLLVEELVRLGVDRFFIAPGSRSTPLAMAALAHRGVRAVIHFDERGLAFAALGCARATGRPAAVITTSGTAAANLFPAVVEASLERIPLLLLTADRPPELRDCGANQAIDQVKLFGAHVRWQFDVPCPDGQMSPRFLLGVVDQAHARAQAGPVHLNLQFREPLAPVRRRYDVHAMKRELGGWLHSRRPYCRYQDPTVMSAHGWVIEDILPRAKVRGIIVAAGQLDAEAARRVRELAGLAGWPLITDIRSGTRQAGVRHADHLLLSSRFAAAMRPEVVLQFGARLVSKRLQQWIDASRPAVHVVVAPGPERLDPGLTVTHHWSADPAWAARCLLPRLTGSGIERWRRVWRRADEAAGQALDAALAAHPLSEPAIARLVCDGATGRGLVLASSMPVRDADMYAHSAAADFIIANRGASGIDGTLATAAGAALGTGRPVTLLTGDLSLLHDLNSLALLRDVKRSFVIVAINNDGGGIFHFLPVAEHPEHFERLFGTPHGLGFEAAARQFGLRYAAPASAAALSESLMTACAYNGPTLIEVRTDRSENLRTHRAIQQQVRAAVDRAVR